VRRAGVILVALLTLAAAPGNIPAPVIPARTPAPGPLQIIGGQSGGCIAGAVRLPDNAAGMQTIRSAKSSFWGAPSTIERLQLLARRAQAAGLPDLFMGDISNPRGGPLAGGHASHQLGIDADVYFDLSAPHPVRPVAAREGMEPPSLVRPDGLAVDPARWRPEHMTLLRIVAGLPDVDRVLVNPAIKKALCEQVTGDRGWLRLIRPWYGHSAHLHIRFQCPAGQAQCVQAPPPPPGDGCDATLQWWFDQLAAPKKPPVRPAPPRLPAACAAVMAAADK
jgi:penicillin-insensitive murein endopeptidase